MAGLSTPMKVLAFDETIVITPDKLPKHLDAFVQRIKSLRNSTNYTQGELKIIQDKLMEAYNPVKVDESGAAVDFKEDSNRYCYLFRYGVAHVLGTCTMLNNLLLRQSKYACPEYNKWMMRHAGTALNVCSIGGGSGTDVFALQAHLNWLTNEQKVGETLCGYEVPAINNVSILDQASGWGDIYEYLRPSLELPAANYAQFDFGKILYGEFDYDCIWKQHLQNADVVVMIKFASSVIIRNNQEQVRQTQNRLKELVSWMKEDALLLYVDTKFSLYVNTAYYAFGSDGRFEKLFDTCVYFDIKGFDFEGAKPARTLKLVVQLWRCKTGRCVKLT